MSTSKQNLDNSLLSLKPINKHDLVLYKRRFLVCIAFAYNSMVNAMMWITFAPISKTAQHHFDVSATSINMLSMVFMICYVPGSILCAWMFRKYYLRKSFLASSACQTFGAILRFLATMHFIFSYSKHISFIILLIGQTLAAMSQPFYTNSPSRIPAEWFSKEGRDIATAILSIINPLGIGLGSVIPTLFVSSVDEKNHFGGFRGIMLTELIAAVIGFFLTYIWFYDKPPTSPSISQKLKQQVSLKTDFYSIMNNKHFFYLFCGFGIGLGLFNSITTLINQYTAAFGYSTDNAGTFGGLLIGGGLIGAVVAGAAMEILRQYRSILKVYTTLTVLVTCILLWQMKENNLTIIVILFGVFGFVAVPIVAVTFEAAAECTYPANEELSAGLLMTAGSFFGIVYVAIWGAMIPDHYHNQLNFSTYFLFFNGIAMLGFMLLFRGEYRRIKQAERFANLVDEIEDEESVAISNSAKWPGNQVQNRYSPHSPNSPFSDGDNSMTSSYGNKNINRNTNMNKKNIKQVSVNKINRDASQSYQHHDGNMNDSLDKPVNNV